MENARQALHSSIRKSIECSLPAIDLSKSSCYSIMRPIVKCILNQLCVTSNFTQDIICAAPSKGGLGCINLHDMQEKKHAKLAMDVFHTKSVTGDLLECSLQEILLDIVSDCSIGKWEYECFSKCIAPFWWMA